LQAAAQKKRAPSPEPFFAIGLNYFTDNRWVVGWPFTYTVQV
jgi:hypothetical protein